MSYEFIPISFIVIFTYLITYILYNENEITKVTHIRIWNIIILIISLILLSIGLILTALIEYGIDSTLAYTILFWHVEVGIALVSIAFIHIYLYRKSFKKITLRL
jgi:hypothetical protein